MTPIVPERALAHGIALLRETPEARAYLSQVRLRRPSLSAGTFTAVTTPRPCVFGDLAQQGFAWRVLLDVGALPTESWRAGFGPAPMPEHRSHAFVFLTGAPKAASGLERVRAWLDLLWSWLGAGAVALAFPSAGLVHDAATLRALDPARFDADAATALLVGNAPMGRGPDGRFWVRTRGLSQFGLADLACPFPGLPQDHPDDTRAAEVAFASLVPYFIYSDRVAGPGETMEVGARVWKAGEPADPRILPAHDGSVVPLLRLS